MSMRETIAGWTGGVILPGSISIYSIMEKATPILTFYCLLIAAISSTVLLALYIRRLKNKNKS